ncbi:MAG: hypothetical protein ACRDHE_09245, partial [Ktedonobacterales bacterium]
MAMAHVLNLRLPRGGRDLLERLWLGSDQALAVLDDLTIPFDTTQAERDRRRLNVQQKASGCFWAADGSGAMIFTRLRGYHSALRKPGLAPLAALEIVSASQPLYPS